MNDDQRAKALGLSGGVLLILLLILAILCMFPTPTHAAISPPGYGKYHIRTRWSPDFGEFEWTVGCKIGPVPTLAWGPWTRCTPHGSGWIKRAGPYEAPNGKWLRVTESPRPHVGLEQFGWVPHVGPMWIPMTGPGGKSK